MHEYKYTPEIQKIICDDISEGHTKTHAAQVAGIGRRTLFEWEIRHPDFAQSVKDAEQRRNKHIEEDCLTRLHEFAKKYWTVNCWLLERLMPERYALRTKHEVVTGGDVETDQARNARLKRVQTIMDKYVSKAADSAVDKKIQELEAKAA